jgi:DNA-binding IclR family transcriptional regulator
VLDVLDALESRGTLTLSELSRETGAAKSTLHRVCSVMLERGWIARDASTATLALGPRTAWLARAAPAAALTNGFHSVAGRLVARHNETTCLVVLDGLDSLFVAKLETTHPVRLVTSVGSRLPAFASASGRVLLADLSRDRVDAMFAESELVTPTGRRLGGLEQLHRILAWTRQLGYGENLDETALGLHCVAVPVGPAGQVAAALTLCVPSGRMTSERKAEMLPDLVSAARSLAPLAGRPLPRSWKFDRISDVSVDSARAAGAGSIATERKSRHG